MGLLTTLRQSAGSVTAGEVTPNANLLLGWTMDPISAVATNTPAAATIYLGKIMVPSTITVSKISVVVSTAGTSYSNAQVGLYSSAGVLLGSSAVMATGGTDTLGGTGEKQIALSSPVVVAGGPSVYVYAALHLGVNNATAVVVRGTNAVSNSVNVGTAAATGRFVTQTGHATNNLATIGNLTPGSASLAGSPNLYSLV